MFEYVGDAHDPTYIPSTRSVRVCVLCQLWLERCLVAVSGVEETGANPARKGPDRHPPVQKASEAVDEWEEREESGGIAMC